MECDWCGPDHRNANVLFGSVCCDVLIPRGGVCPRMFLAIKRRPAKYSPKIGPIARLCTHESEPIENLRAALLESYRELCGPRQRQIWAAPKIRTCCLRDPEVRRAWWALVRANPPTLSDQDLETVLAKLRAVVPEPNTEQPRSSWERLGTILE
jgi:hypothetical protein